MGDDDDRFFLAVGCGSRPIHDVPVVEGSEVALVADRGPGAFHQYRLELLVAVAALAGAPFPGWLVVTRADPGPGRQVGGVREEFRRARADLGDDRDAASTPMPGMVVSGSRSARKGAIIASAWASSLAIISSRWPMWSRCSRHISA